MRSIPLTLSTLGLCAVGLLSLSSGTLYAHSPHPASAAARDQGSSLMAAQTQTLFAHRQESAHQRGEQRRLRQQDGSGEKAGKDGERRRQRQQNGGGKQCAVADDESQQCQRSERKRDGSGQGQRGKQKRQCADSSDA
ncbi:MAG: hypothetical protein EA402_13695 [Planctomycetota bacterium]|nr:MAG: hypothetical protein EA402_13695 [Planctomycetota bacterium]